MAGKSDRVSAIAPFMGSGYTGWFGKVFCYNLGIFSSGTGLNRSRRKAVELIFVHGKFRQGQSGNAQIAAGSFAGKGSTIETYSLYQMNGKALITKRPVSSVIGEVYEITEELLKVVDRSEGHPHVNKRELVQIKLQDGRTVSAWAYFHILPLREAVVIESGDYCAAT